MRLVVTRDARIDQSASTASVIVVSSDYPYGVIDFDGQTHYNISNEFGLVTLNVVRNRGHIGKLLVSINVSSIDATEDEDFVISPKGWTVCD